MRPMRGMERLALMATPMVWGWGVLVAQRDEAHAALQDFRAGVQLGG
jgi:hypothetical protein